MFTKNELISLIREETDAEKLFSLAREKRAESYGDEVYIRGLIEFSSFCKNDCFYCGLRKSNACAERFRLTKDEILSACRRGFSLGFRTFVLQSGEDEGVSASDICETVRLIKKEFPECAVTLSVGERSFSEYKAFFDAGADRYLLRHESASPEHYRKLHPKELTLENRIRCLNDLKKIGFQVGCGFMVGSPFQTEDDLAEDILFISEFKPHMIGIGPFIPHKDTPLGRHPAGSLSKTLYMLALARIVCPTALIPATTALATLSPEGRRLGFMAGANVVMPNLSPLDVREKYSLYDGKLSSGAESAEELERLSEEIKKSNLRLSLARGDCKRS